MSAKYAGISYDTIYRNLSDFSELNILEETEFDGEKKYRFHSRTRSRSSSSFHLYLLRCHTSARDVSHDFFRRAIKRC